MSESRTQRTTPHIANAGAAADLVAREQLARLTIADVIEWQDVPTINEYDFGLVVAMAQEIVRQLRPSDEELRAAYDYLESRVDNNVE